MAAVRKKAGKLTTVVDVPSATTGAPPTQLLDGEKVDLSRAPGVGEQFRAAFASAGVSTIVRAKLLLELEADRRDHDRLMQRAHEKRNFDEEIGAQAVVYYLDRLLKRIADMDG